MPDLDAKVATRYEFGGVIRGVDGYEANFQMDDSFRSWRSIARWNLHYRHWRALALNGRDLFSKVIWRKLWRQ